MAGKIKNVGKNHTEVICPFPRGAPSVCRLRLPRSWGVHGNEHRPTPLAQGQRALLLLRCSGSSEAAPLQRCWFGQTNLAREGPLCLFMAEEMSENLWDFSS